MDRNSIMMGLGAVIGAIIALWSITKLDMDDGRETPY